MQSLENSIKLFAVTLTWLIVPIQVHGGWVDDPTTNNAVTTAPQQQTELQAITDGSDGVIVVWQDYRSSTTSDLYAQRINAGGNPIWAGNGVPVCTAVGNQFQHRAIHDGAGGMYVVWQDERSGDADLYAQHINSAGNPTWPTNGIPICTLAGYQGNGELVRVSGAVVVVWQDERINGDVNIYAQCLHVNGTEQWTPNGISLCSAVGTQSLPQIVEVGSTGTIVCWTDRRNGIDEDIYAQQLDSTGVNQWNSNGIAVSATSGSQSTANMISDGSGGAILAWPDGRSISSDIYVQKLTSTGTSLWGVNGLAVCTANDQQVEPRLVSDGSGGTVITWGDQRVINTMHIYGQHVNSAGQPQWNANGTLLASRNVIGYGSPAPIRDEGSGYYMTYTDAANLHFNVKAQHINADGGLSWPGGVRLCSLDSDQVYDQIVPSALNSAIVIWRDGRNMSTGEDIYGSRLMPSGQLLAPAGDWQYYF